MESGNNYLMCLCEWIAKPVQRIIAFTWLSILQIPTLYQTIFYPSLLYKGGTCSIVSTRKGEEEIIRMTTVDSVVMIFFSPFAGLHH